LNSSASLVDEQEDLGNEFGINFALDSQRPTRRILILPSDDSSTSSSDLTSDTEEGNQPPPFDPLHHHAGPDPHYGEEPSDVEHLQPEEQAPEQVLPEQGGALDNDE